MSGYIWLHQSDEPSIPRRVSYELKASYDRNLAVFSIFYSLQLYCMTYAMNLLLQRVSDHASHSYYNDARDNDDTRNQFDWRDCIGQYRLFNLARSLHSFSMLLCALNVVARVVVASFRAELAILFDRAAIACDAEGNDSDRSLHIIKNEVANSGFNVQNAASIARLFESATLALMAGAFLIFFPACIIMFRRVERRLDSIIQEMAHRSDAGNVLLPYEFSHPAADGTRTQIEMHVVKARSFIGRLKIAAARKGIRFLLCMIIMLIALAIQASYAVFHAVVSFSFIVKKNPSCEECETCQTIEFVMGRWNNKTPEMLTGITTACSTLPLLFSLWLMMTKKDRAIMLNPSRFRTDAIALEPLDTSDVNVNTERVRMGIDLN